MTKPLLSIGIIFKNEIRCLERCLKSLQPLRDMIPCELIMADTGSTDGSRQVAEKYADLVFDFPWNNDFSAARNSVMEHASGMWYMSIDCDEWLGGDASEIANFVQADTSYDFAAVNIRNYKTLDLDKSDEYSDFVANRLLRMSTGLRFVGEIHERWPAEKHGNMRLLLFQRCFFHHDGYAYIDKAASEKKFARNMALLRKKLEDNPKDLVLLLQCIESSSGTSEYMYYIERAVRSVEERQKGWELFGPAILRYAAVAAFDRKLPELPRYIEQAQKLFPTSIYTRVDVEFAAFGHYWEQKDYENCIQSGERYLKGVADFEAGEFDRTDTLYSTLLLWSPIWRMQTEIFMAASYLHMKQTDKACEMLQGLEGGKMTLKLIADCVRVYAYLHSRSHEDTELLITKLWDEICRPTPNDERAKQRETEFIRMALEVFLPAYQEDESGREDFCRHAYTLFLPLEGKCILGDAAAILETTDVSVLTQKLDEVKDLKRLPVHTLYHALKCGAAFPLANRPLTLEQMDMLSSYLAQAKEGFLSLALDTAQCADPADWQGFCWARGLLLSAVRAYPWSAEGQDEQQGMALARAFAKTEKVFLPMCYSAEALRADRLFVLPPLGRFGWYCAQAFEALDAGDGLGYVRLLREGLMACEGAKDMVEFLIDHTPGLKDPSEDLKELAEQIRAVLARFSPGDPAVTALKQSEVYQKVEYLIEGLEPPVVGNIRQ